MESIIIYMTALAVLVLAACLVYMESRLDEMEKRFRLHREAERELMNGYDREMESIREEHLKVMEKMLQVEDLIPDDIKEEMGRRDILLREMNDEMERGLKMERTWNDGLQSILNYSAATGAEAKNE